MTHALTLPRPQSKGDYGSATLMNSLSLQDMQQLEKAGYPIAMFCRAIESTTFVADDIEI